MTATSARGLVLLGTVNLEPNRWGLAAPGGEPLVRVSDWVEPVHAAGFDGIELWERHATTAPTGEVDAIAAGPTAVEVFNTYASWDDPDDATRDGVADWIERFGASGVKFNVGADADEIDRYTERVARFDAVVPRGVRLLCECHSGTVAEDPDVAASIFDAVAGTDRLQAIVHLHPTPDDAFAPALDRLGPRIGHVHVQAQSVEPDVPAVDLAERFDPSVARLLDSANEALSWTVEFSHGISGFETGYDSGTDRPDRILHNATRDLTALRVLLDG